MPKIKPCYLKSIAIVHGKSEKQLCDYIKSNLRIKMEIISEKGGEKSIQINSLKHLLKDKRFTSLDNFIAYFNDVEIIRKKTKKMLPSDFKIFIIMDTDDCTEEQKENFISKQMFKQHWAYEHIVPIFNTPDLESVLVKAGIKFEKKGSKRKKEYIKIFPTDKKYSNREGIELKSFAENLEKVQETNLHHFIQFCLSVITKHS
ncbi:MAG: hypothetical protein HFH15_08885 [Ruminococcus sp.]|nr:hypothetical protein [Ruminococcus sp.]